MAESGSPIIGSAADWWGIDVSDQDRMAVEQQGVIADCTKEHLGASDGGIVLMRRMMREALSAVAAGRDPLCIIREPTKQIVEFRQHSTMMAQGQEGVSYAMADPAREPVLAK